ncbi:MAG: DNA-processing protein DprA [Solirubrobacterales bacterium]|nr:MAG: DNA-processing protein DprA [Solirubrobacterales bacterium]
MGCADCLQRGVLLQGLAARLDRIVDRGRGSRARDLLALDDQGLCRAAGTDLDAELSRQRPAGAEAELEEELKCLESWSACRHDPDWPDCFRRLGESAPRALFGRGKRELLGSLGRGPLVTVIGARRAGPYGLEVATALARELAAAGLPVVSGMALGVDSAAHRGALDGGGLTAAVLASGPERAYPRARAALHREIAGSGLILSELPPSTSTFRWMFPARNRLMAALAEMTIVVEAAERSGSLITAEMAADCGRLVGAVPGPVNSWRSSGANMLLADGASVVRGSQDVLDHLLGVGAQTAKAPGPRPSEAESVVLDAVEAGAGLPDPISAATGLDPDTVDAAIARLELDGYLAVDFTGRCRRTAQPAPNGGDQALLQLRSPQ